MDENTIIGAAKEATGRVERSVGAIVGDPKTEIRGAARELGGATQRAFGDARDDVRGAVNGSTAPFLAGVSIGLVVGLFLSRR
ncbi:MAG TPA: CsbD family protein [Aliidongia sp.]|uniref:CsbD family protein n=1 Tax=Aliidongia sp. TaxID=1914230 RepID=UPI002DDD90B0|nr:CsbD family protein [Aliidongia sp.]HEV2675405.1 CsbD family protein [Aliidongia sp.]